MSYPIVDLHCDLLAYLVIDKNRTPFDTDSHVGFSQLKSGGVRLQTLAIYSETGKTPTAQAQADLLTKLFEHYPEQCAPFTTTTALEDPIHFIAAIENASAFASEEEPLAACLERLERLHHQLKHIFYISLTWNGQNRFGGGVGATCGLKSDGKELLNWMQNRKIAIDFSHTSDQLAEEILNCIDANNWNIPVMASHSNFRTICDKPRNLPEWLAHEIIHRKGIIGINFVAPFIRPHDPSALFRHIEYALSLGAENALCFGADFFCDSDFPGIEKKYDNHPLYFPEYGDASCYPHILEQCAKKLNLSPSQLTKIASGNALQFLSRS